MISKNILAKTSFPEYQCNMIGAEVKHIPIVLQEITLFKLQEPEMSNQTCFSSDDLKQQAIFN